MYAFTKSTPERACCYVSGRTHKNLMMRHGAHQEGSALYWVRQGAHPRFIGTVVRGALVKPGAAHDTQ